MTKKIIYPSEINDYLITENGSFPNNSRYPLLLYKNSFQVYEPEFVDAIFSKNNWKNSWRNGIYTYHHYHSNTHEVLAIYEGTCKLQMGGMAGKILELKKGDILIVPAGVSHKNHESSDDFKCLGAYPYGLSYDMKYGKETELAESREMIDEIMLPPTDPLYGSNGPLFEYWKD